MWFAVLCAAMIASCIPAWFTVSPPEANPDALQHDGDRLVLHSEPWFGRTRLTLVGFGVALIAVVLSSFALVGAIVVLSLANVVISRLEHRTTTVTLDRDVLEVTAPWLAKTRTTRIALRDITSVEIGHDHGGVERGASEYVQRSLRLRLANGTRGRVPLPMADNCGDAFHRELCTRVAASAAAPEPTTIETLVQALATSHDSSLYRGEHQHTTIDPDRLGIVREHADHRLALHFERDGTEIIATLRIDDRVLTKRFAASPSAGEIDDWIALEAAK